MVGLSVGTRPDSITDEAIELLAELARDRYVCVELGLQSMDDAILAGINRGHTLAEYLNAVERIAGRILRLKKHLVDSLLPLGFEFLGPLEGDNASGITTFRHPRAETEMLFECLEGNRVVASLRFDREGRRYLRLSPHFYNTVAELDTVLAVLRNAL